MEGFCPLASGSKGNALFFRSNKTKILIDAGLSAKTLESKLADIDVDLNEIEAIIISHEHSDHIAGLKTLALKRQIPIFANSETAKEILNFLGGEKPKFKIFTTGESFVFKDIEIHPFSIQHDAMDPVAFTLKTEGIKVGLCTDLGFATTLVANRLKQCHYLYLEANHEPSMVHASARPAVYKQRVLSKNGHLSNEMCGKLIQEVFHAELRHVHLAHLSQECNHPTTALKVVKEQLKQDIDISIAPQNHLGKQVFF